MATNDPNTPTNPYSKPDYPTVDYFYNNEVQIQPWNDKSCAGNAADGGSTNCSTNFGTCPGNTCEWFGVSCPINSPFLLENEKITCETFSSDIDNIAPDSRSSFFNPPIVGGTVTADHINALRDSLLDEYSERRWVVTSTNRTNLIALEELVNEVIDAPSIQSLAALINVLTERGTNSSGNDPYDFGTAGKYDNWNADPSLGGFSTTYSLSAIPPNTGETIDASVVRAMMDTVDELRRSCICNTNCQCFGECTCNWNCKCNY